MPDRVEWSGTEDVRRRMAEYGQRVQWARMQVAQYWAAVFEAEAKAEGPWQDRTGNARQSLHGYAQEIGDSAVAIYLSHGVEYGLYLEVLRQGRYAVILPILERHYQAVMNMVREIFS